MPKLTLDTPAAVRLLYATLEQWQAYLPTVKTLNAAEVELLAQDLAFAKEAVDVLSDWIG